jgi:hypothetical protein
MSQAKKVSSDSLTNQIIFDEAISEAQREEWAELVARDDFLPEIKDVLGSFSEQTGAQFG